MYKSIASKFHKNEFMISINSNHYINQSSVNRAVKNNLKCFKNYGKCMKSLPKTMFNIIYTGARKEVTLRCESSEARNDFQSMSSTLGPKIHLDRIVEKLTNFFDYTVSNVTKNDQLSYLCCGYHYFNDEMYTAILGSSTESNAKVSDQSITM